MMATRDLSLTKRAEAVRDSVKIAPPVHFSTEEIKNHFTESMNTVRAQFDVAEGLLQAQMKKAVILYGDLKLYLLKDYWILHPRNKQVLYVSNVLWKLGKV